MSEHRLPDYRETMADMQRVADMLTADDDQPRAVTGGFISLIDRPQPTHQRVAPATSAQHTMRAQAILAVFSRDNDYVEALIANGDIGCWHLRAYALHKASRL